MLKIRQVLCWARTGLILAFKGGAALALCEGQRVALRNHEQSSLAEPIYNNISSIWRVAFPST